MRISRRKDPPGPYMKLPASSDHSPSSFPDANTQNSPRVVYIGKFEGRSWQLRSRLGKAALVRKYAAFLSPTALVLLGFAAWGAAGRLFYPDSQAMPPELVAPSALAPEHLLQLGADQVVQPDPTISPQKVVETQLAGLADHKSGAVGILQCFTFASPTNRAATGPLDRFGAMVRQGEFACFTNPAATLIGEPHVSGRLARLLVTVVDQDRQLRAFTFILSRQTADPYRDCWMTEAVFPVGSSSPAPPAPPEPASESSREI